MNYRGSIKSRFGPERRYTSLGITVNSLNYFGDLSPSERKMSTDLSLTKPGIGLTYSWRVGPRITLEGGLLYNQIRGSDLTSADKDDLNEGIFRYNRGLSFRNRITELSLTMILDLFRNESFYNERVRWTPFLFFGIAIFHHNPQAQVPEKDLHGNSFENPGEWVNLRDLGTEGQFATLHETDFNYGIKPYNLIQPAIPVGVGVRVRLQGNLDFSGELSLRYLFTDYLDDVSKNYVDLGVFGNNELARSLSYRSNEVATPNLQYTSERDGKSYTVLAGYGQESKDNKRGNSGKRDGYTIFKVRLSYILPKNFTAAKRR